MALLEIVTFPDPRLRETCEPVEEVDDQTRKLIEDMAETLYGEPGRAGLAAPQVGSTKRIIVCDPTPRQEPRQLIALVNPEIVESEGEIAMEEGCLSCPEVEVEIPRAQRVKVRGLDPNGEPVEIEGEDFAAILFQHELDHLDGVLIVDYLSSLKRGIYRRKMKKLKAEDQKA